MHSAHLAKNQLLSPRSSRRPPLSRIGFALRTALLPTMLIAGSFACGDNVATEDAGSGSDAGNPDGGIAPSAPTALMLSEQPDPFGVTLSWQAPSGSAVSGYLIARSAAVFDTSNAPVAGQTYQVGDTLPNGPTVVAIGVDTTAFDPTVPIETTSHYAVFAHNGAAYSEPAVGSITIARPPLVGQIIIDPSAPSVTIMEQPLAATLSATVAATGSGELTLALTLTNKRPRILFSAKVAIDSVVNGTVISDGTTVDGRVAAYYGPQGLAADAARTRNFVITSFDSGSPIALDVELLDNPMMFTSTSYNKSSVRYFDVSGALDNTGNAFGGERSYPFGWKSAAPNDGRLTAGAMTSDGTSLFAGWKSRPQVVRIDMASLQAIVTADLSIGTTNYGQTSNVVMSADETSLYTLVTTGAHRYSGGPNYANSSSIDLVRLNRATLAETGRISLVTNAPKQTSPERPAVGNYVALSGNGEVLVAAVEPGQLWVVDRSTFTVIDADTGTAGDQPVSLTSVSPSARVVTVNSDGTKAYVGFHEGGQSIAIVDLTTFAITTIPAANTAVGKGWSALTFGPDGRLYVGRNYPGNGTQVALSTFDVGTSQHTDRLVGAPIMGVLFHPAGDRYYVLQRNNGAANNFGEVLSYDQSTHDLLDIDGDAGNGQTNLPVAGMSAWSAHCQGITPF